MGEVVALLRTRVVRLKTGFVGQVCNGMSGEVLWQGDEHPEGWEGQTDAQAEANARLDRALRELFAQADTVEAPTVVVNLKGVTVAEDIQKAVTDALDRAMNGQGRHLRAVDGL